MSIEQFLDSKRREYLLNENLQEWSKGSKVLDDKGFPLVAFHGSFHSNIEEIKINMSHDSCFVTSGFYTSNSPEDINKHYVKTDLNNDFSGKIDLITQRLLEDNSFDFYNTLFNVNNITDHLFMSDETLDSASLTYDSANYLLEHLGIKNIYKDFEEDDIMTFEDFLKEHAESIIKNNEGCIYPVFIKMEKPLYLTKDDNSTKLRLFNTETLSFIEENYSENNKFSNFVDDLVNLLEKKSSFLDKDTIYSFYDSHCVFIDPAECSSSFFYQLKDYLEIEYNIEEDDNLFFKIKELMSNYYYYDLDNESFEEMIYFDVDFNDENFQNYKKFIDMFSNNENYNSYIHALNNIIDSYFEEHETYDISFYDFHLLLNEEEELIDLQFKKDYEKILHNLYDGVVLSVDALNEDGVWRFKTELDTYHYIVFDPKNIKSAIGNNGDYSLDNLKICAKMHDRQKTELETKNIAEVQEYIEKFNNEYSFLKFSYEHIEQEVDALYDRYNGKVVFNSKYIHNKRQLKEAFEHEVFGHFALDFIFGKDKDKFLESIGNKIPDSDLLMLELKYPHLSMNKPKERLLLIEERIAEYATSQQRKNNFLNKVLSFIELKFKQFKQKFGLSNFKDDIFVFLNYSKPLVEELKTNNSKKMSLKN